MNYLKIIQKGGQSLPDGVIYRRGSKASAKYHNNRFIGSKTAHIKSSDLIPFGELLTDRGSSQHGFLFGKHGNGFREITADLVSHRNTQLIGKSGGHIRFVDNARNMQRCGGTHYRHTDKAAF